MKEIVVNLEAIVLLSFYQIDLRLPGSHSFPISQRSSPYRGNDHKAYSPEPAYQHLREQSLHARSHIGRIGLVEALDLTDSPLQSDVCVAKASISMFHRARSKMFTTSGMYIPITPSVLRPSAPISSPWLRTKQMARKS